MTRVGLLRAAARTTAAGAVTGAALLAWGVTERSAYVLREARLPLLPPGAAPLSVLHLSDLHLTPRRRSLVHWVRDLGTTRPDLVVATGDLLADEHAGPTVLEALAPLLDRPGAFVPGNADYFAPVPKSPTRYFTRTRKHGPPLPWAALAAELAGAGWADLTQRRTALDLAGQRVELRGVDDPYLGRDDYAQVAGPAQAGTTLALGLAHAPEPRVLDAMTRDGLDLVLAGHTHGGQVRVPGIGALTTNCGIDRARARGLATYGAAGRVTALHVSAGLGTSPYQPWRVACRPEATLLALVGR